MKYRGVFVLLLTLFLPCAGVALDASSSATTLVIPALTGPVVDQAGVLSGTLTQRLESYLHRLYDSGGTQIQVVTLNDLGGVSIEEAGIKITDQWKLGRKGRDDAVLLILSMREHKVRIEVGRGHEGELPDALASRIIRERITPRLKAGQYDEAVREGVLSIVHLTDPDFDPRVGAGRNERGDGIDGRGLLILFVLFFFILPLFFRGGGGGGGFLAGAVLGNILGGGGGGGGRNDGGGGWSGGGGGFGGGGASGDW